MKNAAMNGAKHNLSNFGNFAGIYVLRDRRKIEGANFLIYRHSYLRARRLTQGYFALVLIKFLIGLENDIY